MNVLIQLVGNIYLMFEGSKLCKACILYYKLSHCILVDNVNMLIWGLIYDLY